MGRRVGQHKLQVALLIGSSGPIYCCVQAWETPTPLSSKPIVLFQRAEHTFLKFLSG